MTDLMTDLAVVDLVEVDLVEVEVVNDDHLSEADLARLKELEGTIEAGIEAYLSAGQALKEIRDSRLYTQYGTFEEYCQARFGFSRSRAYQLVSAFEVVGELSTVVDTLPQKESHVRELAKLPVESRAEVWQSVLQDPTPPTAGAIRSKARQMRVLPRAASEAKPVGEGLPEGMIGINHQVMTFAEAAAIEDDPVRKHALIHMAKEHGQVIPEPQKPKDEKCYDLMEMVRTVHNDLGDLLDGELGESFDVLWTTLCLVRSNPKQYLPEFHRRFGLEKRYES